MHRKSKIPYDANIYRNVLFPIGSITVCLQEKRQPLLEAYAKKRKIMFQELRIKNFKGWKDTQNIRMSPLTLFFGTNSSGKSSIGQFLMMLRQTMDSSDRKVVFYPGGKNSAVHLGSYQDMVFHRDSTKSIEFEYKWTLNHLFEIKDLLSDNKFSGDSLAFNASVGLETKDLNSLSVNQMQYSLFSNDRETLKIGMKRHSRASDSAEAEYDVTAHHYKLKRKKGRVWYSGAPARFYGFPNEVVSYYQNIDSVQELNLLHEELFHSLFYLGPLRRKAERLYSWTGTAPESVGYEGEDTIGALLAAKTRKIKISGQKEDTPFEQVIAEALKKMGLIERFKVNRLSEQRQEYDVKVCTNSSNDWVDLPDVGFGISQVLPVLVQCFYAPANSIIIMEQPEIHLHPSAQAALADVLIDVINSSEKGKPRNIQLIVETHSEHFLRRLQRRIAEDKISQQNVAAYFANASQTPIKLEALQIDELGNILNWPENFFGDEMDDIIAQSKMALKKRKALKLELDQQ